MKSVRIWSFSGKYFAVLGLNMDQKNSEYEHFSYSVYDLFLEAYFFSRIKAMIIPMPFVVSQISSLENF